MQGRMSYAPVPERAKHPYIIPSKHIFAGLIIRHFHMKAHLGCEWIHSHIHQYFWIIRARSMIKRIKSACIICRKRFAGKCVQQMSSLPEDRVRPGEPPFSMSGVDCFGPFMVKYGRAEIKRYGCIYTSSL